MESSQVAIVGGGPAGLLLGNLLLQAGIDCVVLERHSREHVEARVRAGILEQGSVDVLTEAGLASRLHREALAHHSIEIAFNGRRHRLDLKELSGGRLVTVYGQQEVVKDLIAAFVEKGGDIRFSAPVTSIHEFDSASPRIRFEKDGHPRDLQCDFIAGCDGFHGVCRSSIPENRRREFTKNYPFGWLGILVRARSASKEVSMRSADIARFYLQCDPDEDLSQWPDDRIWKELRIRNAILGIDSQLDEGEILQKGVTAMRSFACEPMRFGQLFLAGDSAHICPPTGAKGMSFVIADVRILARGLIEHYRDGNVELLDRYSEICLRRIWKAQRFSEWMTSLLHRFPGATEYDHRVQTAELEYLLESRNASATLAENYVGLHFEI